VLLILSLLSYSTVQLLLLQTSTSTGAGPGAGRAGGDIDSPKRSGIPEPSSTTVLLSAASGLATCTWSSRRCGCGCVGV
jgi:hypothetical protein